MLNTKIERKGKWYNYVHSDVQISERCFIKPNCTKFIQQVFIHSLFFLRRPDSIENLTVTSPSTIAPVSTSLMSFDGTIASTIHNSRQSSAGQNTRVDNRTAPHGSELQRISRSQCGQEARNQKSELTDRGVSRQDSTSQVIKSVFVQGVGWASQVSYILLGNLMLTTELKTAN